MKWATKVQDSAEWHQVFAWLPTKVFESKTECRWIWLEQYQRRAVWKDGCWEVERRHGDDAYQYNFYPDH